MRCVIRKNGRRRAKTDIKTGLNINARNGKPNISNVLLAEALNANKKVCKKSIKFFFLAFQGKVIWISSTVPTYLQHTRTIVSA